MAGFIPVPNTAQVEIINTWNGQTVETVLHYSGGVVTNATVLTNLAGSVNLLWQTHIAPIITDDVSGDVVRATDISTATGPVVEVSNPVSGSIASGSGLALPPNIALAVKKVTALRGRSYRGRIYHYGMTVPMFDTYGIKPADEAAILSAWNNFLSFTNVDATWTMQVVSRFNNNAPRVTGVATPVQSLVIVNNVIDSQRRRLPGRGN